MQRSRLLLNLLGGARRSADAVLGQQASAGPAALRLFLAVQLPDATARAADRLVAKLMEKHPAAADRVKWVDPSLMHLTLEFLGEVQHDRLLELEAEVPRALSRGQSPFRIAFARGGVFWAGPAPTVLWLGPEAVLPECRCSGDAQG
mmetsp:Transcript_168453/g.541305  ORF Transcript_168453/g.541305 Transcript_168453/m.541305 type:complete len:147 (+) Transcript_168453:118-558(+)